MCSATTVVPAPPPRVPVAIGAGMSHRGCLRDRNEDAILTDLGGTLWAVADGMGGYGHGDVASDIVIDCLETITDDEAPDAALRNRLTEANSRVRARAAEPDMGQMGSTAVAVIVARAVAHLAWVGDARAYLFRGGRLRLLTRDHSVVQDLVERGELSPSEAEGHPEAHIVTRAVGGEDTIEVDQTVEPLVSGDRLLLCSDGLPRAVYEGTVATILAQKDDPATACAALVSEALANGAPDNVSVIVIDLQEAPG